MSDDLTSWHDTGTRQAIVEFVERVTTEGGPDYVPPSERIAVFDNDGTLWCEKPMPIELGFILMRLAEMAESDESLRGRQPWKAAYDKDYGWLGEAITKHYHGDESDVKLLMGGIMEAFAGQTVDEYSDAADAFLRRGKHPTLGRAFDQCGYQPMIELLGYLETNGFTNYIASGGDRDFMRPVTDEIYGIPSERVIGSSNALAYTDDEHGGTRHLPGNETSSTTARSSPYGSGAASAGARSSPAATPTATSRCSAMPAARSVPALRLLVLHDDEEREFAYTAGAETRSNGGRARLDRRQHQERLGDRVRQLAVAAASHLGGGFVRELPGLDLKPPANGHVLRAGPAPIRHQTLRRAVSRSQLRPPRASRACTCCRDGEVALPDELSDPHPWHPAQMQQRDAAVAEVVRRPERDRGRPARLRYRGAERVGA